MQRLISDCGGLKVAPAVEILAPPTLQQLQVLYEQRHNDLQGRMQPAMPLIAPLAGVSSEVPARNVVNVPPEATSSQSLPDGLADIYEIWAGLEDMQASAAQSADEEVSPAPALSTFSHSSAEGMQSWPVQSMKGIHAKCILEKLETPMKLPTC